MNSDITPDLIFEMLCEIPMIDAHTHLVNGRLGARGLHDILLYHMAVSELFSAGCSNGSRLTQFPGWPDKKEAHARIKDALPFLDYVRNTSISWGIRLILKDLYNIDEPVTEKNWERIDAMIRERADEKTHQRNILQRSNIEMACTELVRNVNGTDDDILRYSLEWIFVARVQWGEFDTALYELERVWGKQPESATPIGPGLRINAERTIKNLDDVHEAIEHYINTIPYDKISSVAVHISSDIDMKLISDSQMEKALQNRVNAGVKERDIFASYVHEHILNKLAAHGDKIIYQFSYGAEPLQYETASRVSQHSIAQMAEMITRHPKIRFQCFLSSMHANQSMCTLAREIPNLSLTGIWWHNFYPSIMRTVLEQRLDMLPLNKQIGFFSDAYVVEWAYAKAYIIRKQFAEVLTSKIKHGQYTLAEAMDIYKHIVYTTPKSFL
jgi:glucuronate isomerase